jgi:1-acyl-sn-glycerol-3-phosphate acyltransferase
VLRKRSIDQWALDYWLLQRYAKLCWRLYYRNILINDLNNIPANRPVILAPNHQNALMDALAMVCGTEFQVVFLARADIFKGRFLTKVLTFMNIMPIYRIRDGYENVKRNDEVFEKTNQVLRNMYNPLGIFPEGNHGDRRRLRSLVKGLFRISFMAQEEYGEKQGIVIIPLGINYGHYQNFRSTLLINYGQPIEVADYYSVYTVNPGLAINQLKERYAAEVSKLMIDIQTEEYYQTYMALRTIFNDDMRNRLGITDHSLTGKFKADKAMIAMLDKELASSHDFIKNLDAKVTEYQSGLQKTGLRDWVIKKEKFSLAAIAVSALLKILFLPLFIAGIINNILPYWYVVSKGAIIKDTQFQSSFKFVIGMLVFPIWYLVFGGLLCFVPVNFWIKLLYVLLMPVTGLFAFHYYISLKKLKSRFVYTRGVVGGDQEILKLTIQRKSILGMMNELFTRQIANHEN